MTFHKTTKSRVKKLAHMEPLHLMFKMCANLTSSGTWFNKS